MSNLVGAFDPSGALPSEEALRAALAAEARRGIEEISVFADGPCAMAVGVFDPSDDGRHPGRACDPQSGATVFVDGVLDSVDLRG